MDSDGDPPFRFGAQHEGNSFVARGSNHPDAPSAAPTVVPPNLKGAGKRIVILSIGSVWLYVGNQGTLAVWIVFWTALSVAIFYLMFRLIMARFFPNDTD